MMRLIYITNARIPTEKAHGVQIMSMCEAFALQGAEVELLVPRRRNPIKIDPYEFYSVRHLFKIRKLPSLDVIFLGPIGSYVHEISFAMSACAYVWWVRTFAKNGRERMLYVRGERLFRTISRCFSSAAVFHETHVNHADFARHLGQYRRAAGTIVVTSRYRDDLLAAGFDSKRVLLAPDGVNLRNFDPHPDKKSLRTKLALPPEDAIIGYVGKLSAMGISRGVEELITAFADVLKRAPTAFLLIVGANPDEKEPLLERFNQHAIPRERYAIIEHVPHAAAANYMQACDVLVMNYPAGHHHTHYLSPLKLFEYMASGAAIVSSDLPSIRDILSERNALLVPASDETALAIGLLKLLQSPTLAQALAKEARADVQKYTWEVRARNILEFVRANA